MRWLRLIRHTTWRQHRPSEPRASKTCATVKLALRWATAAWAVCQRAFQIRWQRGVCRLLTTASVRNTAGSRSKSPKAAKLKSPTPGLPMAPLVSFRALRSATRFALVGGLNTRVPKRCGGVRLKLLRRPMTW